MKKIEIINIITVKNGFVDNDEEYCGYLSSDIFQSLGSNYTKREHNIIEISNKKQGIVFSGTFKELIEKLR